MIILSNWLIETSKDKKKKKVLHIVSTPPPCSLHNQAETAVRWTHMETTTILFGFDSHNGAATSKEAVFIQLGRVRDRRRPSERSTQAEEGGGGNGMAATVFWNAGRLAISSHHALTWGRSLTSPALGVLVR